MNIEDIENLLVENQEDCRYPEFVNLGQSETGIVGNIRVTTREGGFGPRVIYSTKRDHSGPCFMASIGIEPKLIATKRFSVDQAKMIMPIIAKWISMNQKQLMTLWNLKYGWYEGEMMKFVTSLHKIS